MRTRDTPPGPEPLDRGRHDLFDLLLAGEIVEVVLESRRRHEASHSAAVAATVVDRLCFEAYVLEARASGSVGVRTPHASARARAATFPGAVP